MAGRDAPALNRPYPHFGTQAVHAGQDPDQWNVRTLVPPISLSSTFEQASPGDPVGGASRARVAFIDDLECFNAVAVALRV